MIVDSPEKLKELRESLLSTRAPIAIDTETNYTDSYEERYCMGISLATIDNYYYIPIRHGEFMGKPQPCLSNMAEICSTIFSDIDVPVVFHNAKFDLAVLERMGLELPKSEKINDTMLMHHYIDEESPHDLDNLSKKYCTVNKNVKLAKQLKKVGWEDAWIPAMAEYAQEDAIATRQLYFSLVEPFYPYRDCWENYDRDFMFLLKNMEHKGLPVIREECENLLKDAEGIQNGIQSELGFNPGSTAILRQKFFEELGLKPLTYTPKGLPQVNKKFLQNTNHYLSKRVLEYRDWQKQAGYLKKYLELSEKDGRLHPSFKQHGTVTGRLSCENPNMQQVPRESDIKKMFIPEPGKQLWEIDFRNLELRLTAVYSQCKALLQVFKEEGDVHQMVADQVGVSRQMAKIVNFLITYGGGAPALSFQANISMPEAIKTKRDYEDRYPEIFTTMRAATMAAEENGGKVKMWSGRWRHFRYSSDYHKAFNSIIQGGAFEIVKRSMLLLEQAGVDMRNQVHDSVWIMVDSEDEVIEAEKIMSKWTEEVFGLNFSVDRKRLN